MIHTQWAKLKDFEDYSFSSCGLIISHRRRLGSFRKPSIQVSGYANISLIRKSDGKQLTLSYHRILMKLFKTNPENKRAVNHVNGKKGDNRLINLEWCTDTENMKHAIKTKLKPTTVGEGSPTSVLVDSDIPKIRDFYHSDGLSYRDIAKAFNVHYDTIGRVIRGQAWTHIKKAL